MSGDPLLYLSAEEVARALEEVDVVDAVASALAAHARGEVALPQEAHLRWRHEGERLRSLSMAAAVESSVGVKVINANPANAQRGLPRASALIVLHDVATGRPICILEGARISGLRTAAVTALAAQLLGAHPIRRLALVGAGAIARRHSELLPKRLPDLSEIRIFDVDAERAHELAADVDGAIVCGSAEAAIRGAQLVVPATTTTSGYMRFEWLEPGCLLVNTSLDDALPEVYLRADKVYVDDFGLVVADQHRLLGRMLRSGQIHGPGETPGGSPAVAGELGQVVVGAERGRQDPADVVVVNPFGLAIEDIAVAGRVCFQAVRMGLGVPLTR